MMPGQDDKFKKFFGTVEPDKILNEVQKTLSADKAFIQDEMSEIKSLASGNKALNLIQMADAANRFKQDQEVSKAVRKMDATNEIISKDSHGAKKGRQDIREDINSTEIRLTKEIRAAGGGGQIGGVTQKLNKAGDTRGMHPNSQATQFKPQTGGTTEVANSIKLGLMPSKIGILKEAGGASRALGSLTKNITTADGNLDSAKVERLQEVLQDEKVKDDFNKYVSVLRNVTEKGQMSEGQKKDLASMSGALEGKGLEDVLGKNFLKYQQGRLSMGGVKEFMGMDQGGFNPFDIFRLRNYTKKDGIIQKVTGTQKRIGAEKGELKTWSDGLKEAMIQSDLRKSKQGRDAKREAMLGGVANEGSVFGGRAGIDDEGGAVVKKLDQIEENTRALGKGGGGGGGGSILGMLGLILSAIYLWNRPTEDIVEGVTESPTVWKRGLQIGNSVREGVGTVANAGSRAWASTAKMANTLWSGTKNLFSSAPTNTVKPTVASGGVKFTTDMLNNLTEKQIAAGFGGKAAKDALADGGMDAVRNLAASNSGEVVEAAAKRGTKFWAKQIPFVGLGLGAAEAAYRGFWEGDEAGATAALVSGALSTIPLYGTVPSMGIDGYHIARDIHREPMDRAKKAGKFTKRTVGLFGNRMSELEQDDAYWSTVGGLDAAQRILQAEGDDMKKEDVQYLINMLKKGGREITGGMMPLSKTSIGKALSVEGLEGLDHIENYILKTGDAIENSNEHLAALQGPLDNFANMPDQLAKVIVSAQNPNQGPIAAMLPAGVVPKNHSFQRMLDSISGVGWYNV